MSVSDFIRNNQEPILREWEAFAKTCLPAAGPLDQKALRNQTYRMLNFIAEDIESPQTQRQQTEKSKGKGPKAGGHDGSVAENHAESRFVEGFNIVQVAAEFRALRASVVKLLDDDGRLSDDCREVNRFHEAIDQLLMESVVRYDKDLNRARDLFLGTLVHDMRNPLAAAANAAQLLLSMGNLDDRQSLLVRQIERSTADTVRLVSDLIDVTRSHLGKGLPTAPSPVDLAETVRSAMAEFKTAQPDREMSLDIQDDLRGEWDTSRMKQLVSNLVGNALQHGAAGSPIKVVARGEPDGVTLSVHNEGEPIPPDQLPSIFDAMTRGKGEHQTHSATTSLGLGLFISKEIVTAHGGKIYVSSTKKDGTTFVAWLPRTCRLH